MFRNKLIDEDFMNKKIEKLSKKIKFFILITCCFTVSPKLIVTENLSTIPYIKVMQKTTKEIKKLIKNEYSFQKLFKK